MWPNPQETAELVTFTEETLNEKFQFLCSDSLFKRISVKYTSTSVFVHFLHIPVYV